MGSTDNQHFLPSGLFPHALMLCEINVATLMPRSMGPVTLLPVTWAWPGLALCAFPGVFKTLGGLYPDRMCLNVLEGLTFT